MVELELFEVEFEREFVVDCQQYPRDPGFAYSLIFLEKSRKVIHTLLVKEHSKPQFADLRMILAYLGLSILLPMSDSWLAVILHLPQ
mgnify:CR=1